MKKIFTLIALALLAAGSISAQTMTLTIEGKEVKNGDDVVINRTPDNIWEWAVPNLIKAYELSADIVFKTLIDQSVILQGEDLDKGTVGTLECCPSGFSCTAANESSNYVSESAMNNLTAGQEITGKTFIHIAWKKNEPALPLERHTRITLKGKEESIAFNLTFVVSNETGIETIMASNAADAPAYNIAGQKVGANATGIIIKGGKKTIKY